LATLEGEALLLGIWKNIEDLENSLNLEELELIVKTARDKEHRHWKFMASLKGIDIDENSDDEPETGEEALERLKRKAALRIAGYSEEQIDTKVNQMEIADFGLEVEVEE
jgi:hypothetical protein